MDKNNIDLTNLNSPVSENLFNMLAVAFFTGKAVLIPTETVTGDKVDVVCMWDDENKAAFPLAVVAADPHMLKPPTGANSMGVHKVRVGVNTGTMDVLGPGDEGAKHGEGFTPDAR